MFEDWVEDGVDDVETPAVEEDDGVEVVETATATASLQPRTILRARRIASTAGVLEVRVVMLMLMPMLVLVIMMLMEMMVLMMLITQDSLMRR